MKHWIVAMVLSVVSILVLTTCSAPTPQVIKETVEVVKEVEVVEEVEVVKEVEVTAKEECADWAEDDVVTFATWAAEAHEALFLEEVLGRFREEHPEIPVEPVIVP